MKALILGSLVLISACTLVSTSVHAHETDTETKVVLSELDGGLHFYVADYTFHLPTALCAAEPNVPFLGGKPLTWYNASVSTDAHVTAWHLFPLARSRLRC